MNRDEQVQYVIETIAKMEHAGVPETQIAAACNIEIDKLVQIQASTQYREMLASIAKEAFEKVDVLNGGWDMVENLALNKVVEHMTKVPDADYALRAAALANKAVRRGRHSNDPIHVQPGTQAIINVSLTFADKLQNAFTVKPRQIEDVKQKENNYLPPKSVANMLGGKKLQAQAQLEDELADLNLLVPAT